MPPIVKYLLTCCAVLATGVTQLFGVVRGFACDCPGETRLVSSAVCEAAVCHPGHDHHEHDEDLHHHDHEQSHDHDEDEHEEAPHEHRLVTEPPTVSMTAVVELAPPVLCECPLPVLPEAGVLLASAEAGHRARPRPPDDTGGIPPAALVVADTIVIRV